MAGPDDRIDLDMFIDVHGKPGTVNLENVVKALVNDLKNLRVPVTQITPDLAVHLDKNAIKGSFARQLEATLKEFESISEKAVASGKSQGIDGGAITAKLEKARRGLRAALTLVTQRGIEEAFSETNKVMLAVSKQKLARGEQLTPDEKANVARLQKASKLLSKQVQQVTGILSSVGTEGATFALPLSDLATSLSSDTAAISTRMRELESRMKQWNTAQQKADKYIRDVNKKQYLTRQRLMEADAHYENRDRDAKARDDQAEQERRMRQWTSAQLKANAYIRDVDRKQADARARADVNQAYEENRRIDRDARLRQLHGQFSPLLQRARQHGLGSLSGTERELLAQDTSEFNRLAKQTGSRGLQIAGASVTAIRRELGVAMSEMNRVYAAAEAEARKRAKHDAEHIARQQEILRLTNAITQAAQQGNAADARDAKHLANLLRQNVRHFQRYGSETDLADAQVRLDAVNNPEAAVRAVLRQQSVAHGERVLDAVGGMGNVTDVHRDHAPHVRAYLQDQQMRLGTQLEAAAPNSQAADGLRRQIEGVDHAMRQLDVSTQRTNGVVAQFFRYAIAYGGLWQALAAVKGLATGVTDFEKSLVSIKSVSGATATEMTTVTAAITSIAKSSRYALPEVTEAAKILAQAGVAVKDMPGALQNVLNLASAVEAPMAVVADLMTSMREIFSTESDTSLANQLASAVNISKLTAEGLQTIIGLSANVAQSMQISSEQYLAAVATLKNAGLKDSTVATGLRQLLLELNAPDAKLIKAFQQRYSAVGEKMTNSQVRDKMFDMFQGPGGLMKALTELERLGYNGEGRQTFARAFDIRSQNALEALIREKSKLSGNEISIGFSQASVIGSQQQMQTLTAGITELKNSFILFGDSVGKDAIPPLLEFIDTMTKAVNGLTSLNEKMRAETGIGAGGLAGSTAAGAAAGFVFTGGSIAQRGIGALKGAGFGAAAGAAGLAGEQQDEGSFSSQALQALGYGLMAAQAGSLLSGGLRRSSAAQSYGGSAGWGGLQILMDVVAAVKNFATGGAMVALRTAFMALGGWWTIGVGAIIGLVAMFKDFSKTAEEKTTLVKRQVESATRASIESAAEYAKQKTSITDLSVDSRGTATGMAKQYQDVAARRAFIEEQVSAVAGGAAEREMDTLAAISAGGGVRSAATRDMIRKLKERVTAFNDISESKLSELAAMAEEAQAAPKAMIESLSKTYQQLREMNKDDLTAGQAGFIAAYEELGKAQYGFTGTSRQQMQQIADFFRLAEDRAKQTEKGKEAYKKALDDIGESRKAIDTAAKTGNFQEIINAINGWEAAMGALGLTTLSGLREVIAKARASEASLRGKAKGAAISPEAEKRLNEAADRQKQTGDAAQKVLDERLTSAAGVNSDVRKQVVGALAQYNDNVAYFGGPEAFAKKFGGQEGYKVTQQLSASGEAIAGSGNEAMRRMLASADGSVTTEGVGAINAKHLIATMEGLNEFVSTERNRLEEEKKAKAESEDAYARLVAETKYDAKMTGTQAKISKANTVGELRDVLGEDGTPSEFALQRSLVRSKYGAMNENNDYYKSLVSGDFRHDPTKLAYEKLDEKTLKDLNDRDKELARIAADETDKRLKLKLETLKDEKKQLEANLAIENARLATAIKTGAPHDVILSALHDQEAASLAVGEKAAEITQAETNSAEAAKETLATYKEQNLTLQQRIDKIGEAIKASAALANEAVQRAPWEALGMTKGQYASRQGGGHVESFDERRRQQARVASVLGGSLQENYGLLAASRSDLAKAKAAMLGAPGDKKLQDDYRAATVAVEGYTRAIDEQEAALANLHTEQEKNTLRGMFEYSTGIGESGAKGRMADLGNAQLANAWAEGGDKLRGGIVSSIDAIGEAFVRAKLNGESFKDAFKGIINGVAVDLASFFAKKAVWWFLMSFLGGFGGMGSGTSGSPNFIGPPSPFGNARGGVMRFSNGGMIRGPGTGTSDSIPGLLVDGNRRQPLLLSNGESVLTARATRMLGSDTITAINRGAVRAQSLRYQQAGAKVAQTSTSTTQNNLEIHVPVNIESGAGQSDINAVVAQQLGDKVKMKVRETMIEEARPGGLLYRR